MTISTILTLWYIFEDSNMSGEEVGLVCEAYIKYCEDESDVPKFEDEKCYKGFWMLVNDAVQYISEMNDEAEE